ncbi:GILT-like protein 2 isoform X2 [Leguminivora glycinivorella]|uniref:GILT-like protein 2 isoform X2 n=1 Tax=Leguminivora glycinivorella TaxID=1035111 RepID=UPI00200C738E|nr:GILT-like protein 2 isoform X2 [Leguminivora glycinivorella]
MLHSVLFCFTAFIAVECGFLTDIYRISPVADITSRDWDLQTLEKHEEDGKTVIVCQHGEKECYGNKLHACAIDIVKDMTVAEPYISCMMNGTWGGGGSTDMDATKCGDLMKIDSKPIIECAKGKKGEELLEYYGKETEKVKFHGVPAVRINGEDFDLIDDLKKKICEALKNPPPECKTKNLLSLLNDFI